MAQWMADNGAKNIVLVGRRGIYTTEAASAVENMQKAGANVVVRKCDVSDPDQVKDLMGWIKAEMPPLKGVMHAAVVLDDALIMNLNQERVNKVLAPKMNAAWYLHVFSKGHPLDFFICYSSTSAVFGNPGQGNYSAANTFLDYLAHYRRSQGLPALTINWGYLGEIGVAAGNKKLAERFEAQGVKAVPPSEGLPLLGRLMAQGAYQVSVMRMDWNRMRNMGLGVAMSPRFSSLVKTVKGEGGGEAGGADGAAVRVMILAAAPEQRKELMLNVVRDKVARVLGTSPSRIEVDKPLMDLGLDSLMGVELRNWIEGELKLSLPVVELMQGPTVNRLTDLLLAQLAKEEAGAGGDGTPTASTNLSEEQKKRGMVFASAITAANAIGVELGSEMGGIDLNAEAVLDDTIEPASERAEPTANPQKIFMTGATGFLGAYILRGLLDHTAAEVYCMVRAKSEKEGLDRIIANLEKYDLGNGASRERVIPVLGDLTKPLLGIPEERFNELAKACDVVYHNGAAVEFVYPYSMLKSANVGGVQEALRFACRGRTKPFHQVSTLAVFSLMDHLEMGVVKETDKPQRHELLYGGYLQSKWVGERLVEIAQARGLPASIYRPGIITADSKTGVAGSEDVLSRILLTCIQIGQYPKGRSRVAYTPVDYVGNALVNLSLNPANVGKNFHFVNPKFALWETVIDWVKEYGFDLHATSHNEWRQKLKAMSEQSPDFAMTPLLPLIPDLQLEADSDSGEGSELQFDCSQTRAGLEGSGIACPEMSPELLRVYLDAYVKLGAVPAPTGKPKPQPSMA
jgi:thioester reductase-like protein